jgi:predicted phage terminase large subunit-like protein
MRPTSVMAPARALTRQEKEKALRDLHLLEYEVAERGLAPYFRAAWPVLEPKNELLPNWHQDLIAEYLTACSLRQIKQLIINMPPRYTKSLLVSVCFPTWVWIKKPEERFLCTSYSQSLSTKHSLDRRNLIRSSWYQTRWADRFTMSDDQDAKTEFVNDRRGHMIATSLSGTGTGKGGNYLIVDDPHDASRAESDIQRENDLRDFDLKFSTRLDDKINGVQIVVMQRLHPKDLTGHLLAQGGWEHLCIPAEAPARTVVTFPISKREIVREKDDILHPAREDRAALRVQERKLTEYGYAGQYLQDPEPRQGGILKRAYWQRYDKVPHDLSLVVGFWDFSFKDIMTADYVCGQVWGLKGPNKYLLHMRYKPMGIVDSMKSVTTFRTLFPRISADVIEDKANGPAIIQLFKGKLSGIVAFNPQGSKSERAAAVTPQLEGGNVFIPTAELSRTWDVTPEYLGKHESPVDAFIHNCARFPKCDQDGDIDCLSMALLYLASYANRAGGYDTGSDA